MSGLSNQNVLLGETASYSFTFSNASATDTGFSPFIELAVDTSGPDGSTGLPTDGYGTPVVTAGGLQLTPVQTVNLTTAGQSYTNTFTGTARTAPAGYGNRDTIFIYQLPFGSFTPGQNTAVTVSLPTSNLADVGTTLPVSVTPGFRDDDATAPFTPTFGTRADAAATPELWRLTKTYLGPENETATGPNYKRRWQLDVDVATGQTITGLQIRDVLASSMQWTGSANTVMTAGGSTIGTNTTGSTASTSTPGGTVVGNFGTVVGAAGVDASLNLEFYVPRDLSTGTAVLPQSAGGGTDGVTATNTGSASANWTPIDFTSNGRDGPANQAVSKSAPDNGPQPLQQHSVAVQKAVDRVTSADPNTPLSGGSVAPGTSLLRYTITFQVSDYYAVNDLFLEDLLGDGQRLYLQTGFTPTLTVNNPWTFAGGGQRAATSSGAFGANGNIDYQRRYTVTGDPDSDPSSGVEGYAATGPSGGAFTLLSPNLDGTGNTLLRFNISDELIARGLSGLLVGGEIADGGGGPANNNPTAAFGAATGTIVFWVQTKDEYSDDFPSGDNSVDQGDTLENGVPLIQGTHLSTADLSDGTPTSLGTTSTDDTGTSVTVARGVQTKTVYAINGTLIGNQTAGDTVFSVQAGDRVTYKLTYTLPTSRFEDLELLDIAPLPVMAVGSISNYTFDRSPDGSFNPYEIEVAPDDTFFSTFGGFPDLVPGGTVTVDTTTNTIRMLFGDFDDPQDRFTTISLLVTLPVSNDPFVSDLFLTNQLRVNEGNTFLGTTTVEDLRRFELVRPEVSVYKGAVAANGAGQTVGSGSGQIVFAAATNATGTFTLGGSALGGTNALDSATEAGLIGGLNITIGSPTALHVDAGDLVRYAVVVQNAGRADAFNVRVRDTIPDRYERPATIAGLNLRLLRGDGTALVAGTDYTVLSYDPATGAFEIELADNFTAGNVNGGGVSPDDRSGGLSRGEYTTAVGGGTTSGVDNGSNTVILLYDVRLVDSPATAPEVLPTPNYTITNTAFVTQYSSSETGPDLTNVDFDGNGTIDTTDPSDTANVVIRLPGTVKTLVDTEVGSLSTPAGDNQSTYSAPGNGDTQAVIGELVWYELVITLPEGSTPGADVFDRLDEGLAFVDVVSVAFSSSALSSSNGLTFANNGAANAATLLTNTAVGGSNSRDITFTLGDLLNTDLDNATAETVTIRYRAVVVNTNSLPGDADGNQAGDQRNNSARFRWANNATTLATVSAANVTLVEPVLTTTKDVAVQNAGVGAYSAFGQRVRADAGDNIRYRVTLANPSGGSTRAFDVTLSDALPTTAFVGGAAAFSLFGVTTSGTGTVYRDGSAHTLTAADFAIDGSGTLTFSTAFNYDLDPDVSIAVVVEGVNFVGTTGSLVGNTATARWTSLDGTPGNRAFDPPGATLPQNGVERTGADGEGTGLNNYADADDAVVESPPVVRKTVVATSETHTTGSSLAVGEVVRFRLVASVPEGTIRNFQVQDFLPAGLAFLNDDTARWAFVSTGGNVIGSAGISNVTGLGTPTTATSGIDGNETTLATLTSGQVVGQFNDDNVSLTSTGLGTGEGGVFGDGADVFFRFGDLTNSDNDTDLEYVVVEFNAVLLNAAGNQAGVTRDNRMTLLVDTTGDGVAGYVDVVSDTNGDGTGADGEGGALNDHADSDPADVTLNSHTISGALYHDADNDAADVADVPAQSAPATVTVVEPGVTVVKSASPTSGDPGDPVTFTITLTAGSGATAATAFDVAFADAVPSGFENVAFVAGSLSSTGTVSGVGTVGVAGNTVSLTVGSMAAGATVTFQFTATINDNGAAAPAPGSTLTNTGSITWTSLPGGSGTGGSWTGTAATSSATPGGAGTGTGERTGADGEGGALNDHADSDPADVTLNSHTISGALYHDADNDGVRDAGEPLITDSTTFRLTGTDVAGNAVSVDLTTSTGLYSFTGLRAGTYTITQLDQPTGHLDGRDTPGTSSPGTAFGGSGTAATDDRGTPAAPARDADAITSVVIPGGPSSKTGIDYNFGELLPASLGDRVWDDQNGNGVQTGGEPGVDGAVVVLTGTDDTGRTVAVTATTAGGGAYQFTNLRPGSYSATFTPPSGYFLTSPNRGGNDATDSDAGSSFTPGTTAAATGSYTLDAGETEPTVDAGLYQPVTLGDRVFFDRDADGVQDTGEPGIPGTTVEVVWLGADGAAGGGDDLTFTATTGADGFWQFTTLPPGNYVVTATPPSGQGWTLTDSLDNGSVSATNGVAITLPSGGSRADVDFGFRGTASLGDRVYVDADGDGVQDAGGSEPGLPGVTVTLRYDANGDGDYADADDGLFTTVTDSAGAYTFPNLPAGSYQVSVPAAGSGGVPDNMTLTDSVDDGILTATANQTATLTAGQTRTDIDFGFRGNATLGNRVWIDQDQDGVQDAAEPGISGAVVTLTHPGADGNFATAGDNVTFTVTTGANGVYLFDGLPVYGATDDVRVEVVSLPAAGFTLTDSLDDGAVSATNPVTVTVNGTEGNPLNDRRDVDFGYDGGSTLAGTVYRDDDDDGVQGVGEPGIVGVVVTLTGVDVLGNAVLDPATALPYSATTNATGDYLFVNVVPGTYTLTETQPAAYNDGRDAVGTIGGTANGTGANDATSGIVVGTNETGVEYNFGERGTFLSGTVFRDGDRSGIQAGGEPGIAGVVVTLTSPTDPTFTRTAVTDQVGNYRFDNLPAGGYTLTETQPVGYADTPNNSAGFQPNVRAVSVPLTGLPNQNFGEVLGSLSGVVYLDANDSGTRGADEPGLSGVTVVLTGTDASGAAVRRTAGSDASGAYTFDDLLAGTYTVTEFQPTRYPDGRDGQDNPSGVAGSLGGTIANDLLGGVTLPAGGAGTNYNFGELAPLTRPNTSSLSGTVWLDLDKNGVIDPTETGLDGVAVVLTGPNGLTRTVTTGPDGNYLFVDLPAGTYTVTETQPAEYGSTTPNVRTATIPASLVPVTGVNFGEAPGTLSGTVYYDADGSGTRTAGDPGIAGVVVTLTGTDVNGAAVSAATTTDQFGNYSFTGLPAGTYTVTETQPAGYADGTDTAGTLGGTVGNDVLSAVALPGGGDGSGYDFGEVNTSNPGTTFVAGTVWLDRNRDGVFDPTEPGIPGVPVELLDATGGVIATTTTGAAGGYSFPNVAPGTYSVRETQPTRYGSSTPNLIPVFVPPSLVPVTGLNFGETPASLAGSVYLDRNNNGSRDPGEPGVGGAVVTLTGTDVNGGPVAFTATTDPTGAYLFDQLPASDTNGYTLTETQPAGYADGTDAAGTLGGTAGNDVIGSIPVGAGQRGTSYDFGERGPNGVSGFVYLDYNLNGVYDTAPGAQDRPFGGGSVTLNNGSTANQPAITLTTPPFVVLLSGTDAQGNRVNRSTVTAADGAYSFGDLPAGTYSVYQSTPTEPIRVNGSTLSGLYNGADSVGTIGGVTTGSNPERNRLDVTLTGDGSVGSPAQSGVNYNFGELPPADPFGFVYVDENANGVFDAGEPGIAGVPVTLSGTAFAGTPFARPLTAADVPGGSLTILTDATGRWEFVPIPPGQYAITESVQPAGFFDGVEQNADPNGQPGGPVAVGNDVFSNVNVQPFPVRGPFNFGELRQGSLAGSVYEDRNRNGVRDPGEPGIPGVALTLTGTVASLPGLNPAVRGTAVGPVSLVTDASGFYVFNGLLPGTYSVSEAQPAGFGQGQNRVGTAGGVLGGVDLLSGVILNPGQSATGYDFGEITRQLTPVPPLPVEAVRPYTVGKGMFLSSTTVAVTASVPDFAALGSVNATRPLQFVATGDGPGGGQVRVFDLTNGVERFRFTPFPGFLGGVRTAVADVTGEGIPDIIAAAGPGGGPAVVVFNGDTGAEVVRFFAFEPIFAGGVFVAAADFDRDGRADVVVGADRGGGPRVRVMSAGNPDAVMSDFWGIADANFRGGVRVAVGDVNGDGIPELVTAAGSGGGPRVAGYDGRSIAAGQPANAFPDFFAFQSTFAGGVYLAVGDVDGDGWGDVIAGAGEGGGPRVSSFGGRELIAGRTTRVGDVWAFDPAGNASGARVAAVDLDGDGRVEVLAGTGPSIRPTVAFFDPRSGRLFNQFSPDWMNVANGVFVG